MCGKRRVQELHLQVVVQAVFWLAACLLTTKAAKQCFLLFRWRRDWLSLVEICLFQVDFYPAEAWPLKAIARMLNKLKLRLLHRLSSCCFEQDSLKGDWWTSKALSCCARQSLSRCRWSRVAVSVLAAFVNETDRGMLSCGSCPRARKLSFDTIPQLSLVFWSRFPPK